MLRIAFKWFEFEFEWYECLSNNRIYFRMLRIPFERLEFALEWFEFTFECFEFLSNGSNLHSNASNLFQIVIMCIRVLRIFFKWL